MSAPFYSHIDMHHQVIAQSPPGFDTQTTYRENEPEQEKDDFWEHGFNRDVAIEEPEPVENGKDHHGSFARGETDLNKLPAIPPFTTGQGLPYAPVGWPSPGDVWTWRVGRRVAPTGHHYDRFLILPERLHQKYVPKSYASKNSLARYIQLHFPGMDVDAFFKSFSWKIPALYQPASKVDAASLFEETPKDAQTEAVANDENAQDVKKEGNSRYSQRKRKPIPVHIYELDDEEKPKATPRGSSSNKRRGGATGPQSSTKPKSSQQSARRSSTQQSRGAVDLNFLDAEEENEPITNSRRKKTRSVNFEDENVSIPHIYVSPMNGVLAVSHSPVDVNPEEFDTYLDSLDNLLHQDGVRDDSSILVSVSSPMREYEWAEARMKISSLLEKDFPALFCTEDAAELAALASKLRKDPNLSAEEIVRLKLIEEIPLYSGVFMENKGVIEEADRFFSALELNKAKVASLKYEYSDLKQKLGDIQMEVDANTETVRQIDEQIAQLQARRAELKRYVGSKGKEKVDLSYGRKMVANSIPKVVEEVKSAHSKKGEWECKKENALKREAEILSRFNPLKGFFL